MDWEPVRNLTKVKDFIHRFNQEIERKKEGTKSIERPIDPIPPPEKKASEKKPQIEEPKEIVPIHEPE